MNNKSFEISIVIPVYNSEDTLVNLVDRIFKSLKQINRTFEIVFVNDCSRDNSWNVLKKIHSKFTNITIINLTRNFGEHNAVIAGLNYVEGKYIIIMDDDGQNLPEEIHKLIEKADETGCDVVYTYYPQKKHSIFRNLGSSFTNFCASYLVGKPKDLYLSSFKLIKKDIVDYIIDYKGGFPYIDGLIFSFTKNYAVVEVIHSSREKGRSNYNLKKLVSLWFNMAFNFSLIPLRISIITGALILFFAMIWTIIIVVEKLFFNSDMLIGYASLILLISFLSGTNLLLLGIIGEYVGRILFNTNKKPQFSIREIYENELL